MSYFLIYGSEDGVKTKQFRNAEKLKEYLEEYFTDYPIKFMDYIPEDMESFYGNDFIVIKGEVIKPNPVIIYKTFEIE